MSGDDRLVGMPTAGEGGDRSPFEWFKPEAIDRQQPKEGLIA